MTEQIDQALEREYEAGFVSDIESETFAPGLDEDVIRRISAMKSEPDWMLEWRLKAFKNLATNGGARMGARGLPKDRFPGDFILLSAQKYGG